MHNFFFPWLVPRLTKLYTKKYGNKIKIDRVPRVMYSSKDCLDLLYQCKRMLNVLCFQLLSARLAISCFIHSPEEGNGSQNGSLLPRASLCLYNHKSAYLLKLRLFAKRKS